MPFTKVGRNEYESPSGRKFNLNQVRLYYAKGGHFPGQAGMRDQFPKSKAHYSPTASGAAAKPTFVNSGAVNAAKSSTPWSILRGSKQYFAPLSYTRPQDADTGTAQMADRERRRASRDYNRRK